MRRRKKIVIWFLISVIILAFTDLMARANAQIKNEEKQVKKTENNFKRPAPSRPIQPEIPSANRYQEDKIFLEYADSLYKRRTNDTLEKQILKGNVKFRQGGMWMYCDSAYYYPEQNSLDAFGNVKMEQGDTLFVYADKLFYEGTIKLARLRNGITAPKVRLINKDVTLSTDSLKYNLDQEIGWYEDWGIIDDKVNTLTSKEGFYFPNTKDAEFYKDVVLINNQDGYTLLTDTLYYNTASHLARIESLATIQSENDTIITRKALYETEQGNATLLTRSMLLHRDSTGNVTTLEGDSILYDKKSRISRAYMFRDPLKKGLPMVLNDTAQKTKLIGGFGIYNDSTREAMSYIYPVLIEYSTSDTLFLRADTIRTFIVTEMVPDLSKRKIKIPSFNGIELIKVDSTGIFIYEPYFISLLPYYKYPLEELNRVAPLMSFKKEEDFTPDDNSFALNDSISTSNELRSEPIEDNTFPDEEIREELIAKTTEEDSIPLIPKDFHVAMAYYNARFFKKDIQGVADSILVVEHDSMLYMFRKPIVWSGERQVTGNRIDVHFNDSTADWAKLPEFGMMSEHVDEDFYNQIAGKVLFATFEDQALKTLDVSGNVETRFLPQESDSTYNRLVSAESSFLFLEMKDGEMEKLKMWPEVSGDVTPIFLVKNSQKYLRNFHWWESLRPVREWYGKSVIWADDLGEVPEALESYFKAPSDFGEPKTFSSARFVPAPSLLRDWDELEAVGPPEEITSDELMENEKSLEEENQEAEIMDSEILNKNEEEFDFDESADEDDDSEEEPTPSEEMIITEETVIADE